MTRKTATVTESTAVASRKEARVLNLQAETFAARAHRLYVFGVVFTALFLVGFLCMAFVVADSSKSSDSGDARNNKRAAIESNASSPQATEAIAEISRGASAGNTRDSLASARQAALDQLHSAGLGVKQARERLRKAELELFRYLYSQLSAAIEPAQTDLATTAGPSAAMSVTPAQESKEIQNPQVSDLERELAQAREKRGKLLERLTPSHPFIVNLDTTIADLQARLEKARQTKIIEPAPGVLQLPTVDVPGDGNPTPNLTILTKAHDLMLAAGRAGRDYDAAVEKESSCWAAYYKLPNVMVLDSNLNSATTQSASIATPPSIAVAHPSAGQNVKDCSFAMDSMAQRPALAILLLLGVAFVGALVAASKARYRLPTFSHADEIETRLGMPVLGRLAWADGGAAAMKCSRAEPSWLRRSVLIGEIALGLAIAAVALLAIADFAIVRELASDPLTGIVQAIAKLHG